MKIVIIGCGKTGRTLAQSLSKKYKVFIVEKKSYKLDVFKDNANITTVCGNGTDHELLEHIGMKDTELLIASSNSDDVNILSCYFAKLLGAKHTVAHIREEIYRQSDIDFVKSLYNIDLVINPDYLTAEQIYQMLTKPIYVENSSYISMKKMVPVKLKDIIIIGASRISYYLAKMLLDLGCHVKIIEQNTAKGEKLCAALPNSAIVIQGDGTQHALLLEEGLDISDAFVAITGIDEENLLASIFAKGCGVKRVVTKINRYSYNDLCGQLSLDYIVSPKDITSSVIIDYADELNLGLENYEAETSAEEMQAAEMEELSESKGSKPLSSPCNSNKPCEANDQNSCNANKPCESNDQIKGGHKV